MNFSQLLSQRGQLVRAKKGEHIYRQGDVDRHVYLLQSGLVKAYYLSSDGKEHVKSLLLSGAFIGSLTACHSKQQCSFSLICLENSELYKLSFDDLRSLSRENMEASQFLIDSLLELSMKKERREYEFLCLSAEQRYRLLREREPELIGRVTQNDIARYLGITPVALSRIKARLPC
ncbi:Crp/Fnr family transcriptional regulator [Arenicella xantha]|uniref:CRP-like cAMP-binding protein n=1 Tax=Arenicella xantha TaxID=644221 RepID=A0A395JNE3_9GAMM|nr:Crp/Fnr family transcriptional regulator [Arenicella xantha]RBP51118.1 CRP-like cAMP-binding protein [Arenicella xantha]